MPFNGVGLFGGKETSGFEDATDQWQMLICGPGYSPSAPNTALRSCGYKDMQEMFITTVVIGCL